MMVFSPPRSFSLPRSSAPFAPSTVPSPCTPPLAHLPNTARQLGLGALYVKDESYRFGLNAFKVLGGSYAMGCYLAGRLGKDISQVDHATLTSPRAKEQLGELTFVTATDGNHGRAIVWDGKHPTQPAQTE